MEVLAVRAAAAAVAGAALSAEALKLLLPAFTGHGTALSGRRCASADAPGPATRRSVTAQPLAFGIEYEIISSRKVSFEHPQSVDSWIIRRGEDHRWPPAGFGSVTRRCECGGRPPRVNGAGDAGVHRGDRRDDEADWIRWG